MSRFKYAGSNAKGLLQGPLLKIRIPCKNGCHIEVDSGDAVNGFKVGEDIGLEITDSLSLKVLRADPRFEEIK